jgi:FkbM family methyltransferase
MNSFLKKALVAHRSPYTAVLPYNLNWMIEGSDQLARLRLKEPITLVDVGARGGLPEELAPIRHMIQHIGFEADATECERLSREPVDVASRELFPFFVGGQVGTTEFHLYENPGESSALRPDPRRLRLFAGAGVTETLSVETITLDAFFGGRPIRRPDMLKLDTQGSELSILQAGTECLSTASLVETEVEFFPLYEGQPLFHDVFEFMLDHGFDLLYLNRFFQQRRGYEGFAKGQILFGDALFARREDRLEGLDESRLANYVILLINYGHLDVAHEILASGRLEPGMRDFLGEYLRHREGGWARKRIQKALNPLIDKLALVLLHLRGHNALPFDSDRSWPVR